VTGSDRRCESIVAVYVRATHWETKRVNLTVIRTPSGEAEAPSVYEPGGTPLISKSRLGFSTQPASGSPPDSRTVPAPRRRQLDSDILHFHAGFQSDGGSRTLGPPCAVVSSSSADVTVLVAILQDGGVCKVVDSVAEKLHQPRHVSLWFRSPPAVGAATIWSARDREPRSTHCMFHHFRSSIRLRDRPQSVVVISHRLVEKSPGHKYSDLR